MSANPLFKYAMKACVFTDAQDADLYGGLYFRGSFAELGERYAELTGNLYGKPLMLRAWLVAPIDDNAIPDHVPHTDKDGWRWPDLREEDTWAWLASSLAYVISLYGSTAWAWQMTALGKYGEHNQRGAPDYYDNAGLSLWYPWINQMQVAAFGAERCLMNIGAPLDACVDAWHRGVTGAYQDNTGEETFDSIWNDKIPPEYREQVFYRFGEASWRGVMIDWKNKGIPATIFREMFSSPWELSGFGNMAEGAGILTAEPPYPAEYLEAIAAADYMEDRIARFGQKPGAQIVTITYPDECRLFMRTDNGTQYGQGTRIWDNPAELPTGLWVSLWRPHNVNLSMSPGANDFRVLDSGVEYFWNELRRDLDVTVEAPGPTLDQRVAALENWARGIGFKA